MIHVEPPEEPAYFNESVRVPGNSWLLNNHNSNNFPDRWRLCLPELAEGFSHLCAYSAMHVSEYGAVVEHYLSTANHREMAYEWTNYRYASFRINSRKHTYDQQILDPYEVEDGWFEVQLGSWQLMMTNDIPLHQRRRAQFTMDKLQIQTGRDALNRRRKYYELFLKGESTLATLRCHAPFVYRAVEHALRVLQPPEDERDCFREFLMGDINIRKLERDAPQIAAVVREELPPSP